MRFHISKFLFSLRQVLSNEQGQDLVEYALVIALIALGATASMGKMATGINNAFTTLGSIITSNT